MGNIPLYLGLVILVGAGLGWLFSNPQKIREFRQLLQGFFLSASKSKGELQSLRDDLRDTRVSVNAPVGDQFEDLRVGEMVELSLRKLGQKVEMAQTAFGIFNALNRHPGTQEFSRRGEDWSVHVFDNAIVVIRRPEGYYGFTFKNRVAVSPEGGEVFNKAGETFSHAPYNQEARSYTFSAQGTKITVIDVGYFDVEALGGTLPSPDGMKVKYLLGEDPEGNIVFFSNHFVGTDYFWAGGISLGESIEPFIGSLTRAMA